MFGPSLDTVVRSSGERYVNDVVEPGREWAPLFRRRDGAPEQSAKLERRAAGYGYASRRIQSELERRTRFLEKLVGRGVSDYQTLAGELRRFYGTDLTF